MQIIGHKLDWVSRAVILSTRVSTRFIDNVTIQCRTSCAQSSKYEVEQLAFCCYVATARGDSRPVCMGFYTRIACWKVKFKS